MYHSRSSISDYFSVIWVEHKHNHDIWLCNDSSLTFRKIQRATVNIRLKSCVISLTTTNSHMEPFQGRYRSQDQVCKHVQVQSVWNSSGKHKLSAAAEKKLIGIIKSQSCWNSGVCVHTPVCFTSLWTEAAVQEESSCSRCSTLKTHGSFLLMINRTKKKPSGGKFCGPMKQRLKRLVSVKR